MTHWFSILYRDQNAFEGEYTVIEETPVDAAPTLELLEVTLDGAPIAGTQPAERPSGVAWRLVAAGIIAVALIAGLVVLMLRNQTPMAEAALSTETVQHLDRPAMPPSGLEGFAELYLGTYLTAAGPERTEQLRRFYPGVPESTGNEVTRFVRQVVTLDVVSPTDGAVWDVQLAADVLVHDGAGFLTDGIHHYRIGIAATGQGMVATGLPVRVAAPAPSPIAATRAAAEVIDDQNLIALVSGFLDAYLTGTGDVRSFAANAAVPAPIAPAPFARVIVDEVTGAPLGPDRLWLRVVATGAAADGDLRIEHHLVVAAAGGAWVVEELRTSPPVPAGGDPPPAG